MALSFSIDGATVLLSETKAIEIEAEKVRAFIQANKAVRRTHLFPLFDAVATFACSMMMIPQGCAEFKLPRSPWILVIGDDMHCAWGPEAFPATSLDATIAIAEHCVLIASGPEKYPYRVAATMAVRHRKNIILIETLPHQQEAWRRRIDKVRNGKEMPMFMSIPKKVAA